MLPVIVPTGLVEYASTASGRRPVVYRCSRCGRTEVTWCELTATGRRMGHVLSRSAARERARNAASESASEALTALDEDRARMINEKREYGYIDAPVTCPDCGIEQPWSGLPRPWRPREHRVWRLVVALLALFMVYAVVLVVQLAPGQGAMGPVFAVGMIAYALALLSLPFLYRSRKIRAHDRAVAALPVLNFDPPVYLSAAELARRTGTSCQAPLRPPAHVAPDGFCSRCGAPRHPGSRFCTNCGAPLGDSVAAGADGGPTSEQPAKSDIHKP
ncbi:zinc ribbon domain-containing protein [Thermophilibacter sp.]